MKSFTIVALCVVFIAAVCADDKYDDALTEGVDIDEALNNDRLRKNYLHCFKTGEKCTAQAKKVKELIPEGLTTNCAKCSEHQKDQVKKVFRFTIKNHPEEFLELEKIYDPERKYRSQYSQELTKEGLVLPN